MPPALVDFLGQAAALILAILLLVIVAFTLWEIFFLILEYAERRAIDQACEQTRDQVPYGDFPAIPSVETNRE